MLTRRRFVAAAVCAAPLTAACAATGEVLLPDFRKAGERDDTAALARAFATGRPVRAPAGGGAGPGGRYLIGNDAAATLPAGASLTGDGIGKTIIAKLPAKPFILHADSKSASPARNIAALRFADLSFEDDPARPFSEYSYLLMLSGVSDVAFDRVGFRGWRGDAIHLGSSTTSKTERHNLQVAVRDCLFDGVDANNRNAISVIDCAGLTIERSRFLNCSRPGNGGASPEDPRNPRTGVAMPGAIDLEPNADAFAVVRDVVIRNNEFRGGGGYAVALYLRPNDQVRTPQANILIADNRIADRDGGFAATGFPGDGAVNGPTYGIVVRNNQVQRCAKPFLIGGIRGITVDANGFEDCAGAGEIGYAATAADVRVTGNRFVRVGSAVVPYALWVRDTNRADIAGNLFDDCGAPGGTKGIAVGFVGGTQRRLRFAANRFRASTGRMEQAVTVFRDARIDRASLQVRDNDLQLRGSGFLQSFGVDR